MRIISGRYKGRIIKMPKGIRPTQNKARKALFDTLGDISDLTFLELFAGSGAVGLEALSQGAKQVVFVEKDNRCCQVIEENISYLGQLASWPVSQLNRQAGKPANRLIILNIDVLQAITSLFRQKRKFDIIFLDPPYYQDMVPRLRSGLAAASDYGSLAKKTLQTLGAYDILAPNGFIITQHFKKDILEDNIGNLIRFKQAKYGDTILSFYINLCNV